MITKSKVITNGTVNFSNVQISLVDNLFVLFTKVDKGTLVHFFDRNFKILKEEFIENSYLEFSLMYNIHSYIGDRLDRAAVYIIRDQELLSKNLDFLKDWCLDDSNYGASYEYIRVYKFHEGKLELGVFEVNEELLHTDIDFELHFNQNFVFNYNELNIVRINPKTLEPIWSKDYTDELDHIEGMNRVMAPIIGVHSDVFVFVYQQDWTVGVDVNTGEILWKFNEGWVRAQILDNGNIFLMGGSRMLLRDIKTGKLISSNDESQQEILSQRMNYTFIGDHVILTGRPSDTIGAYNTKTYKYDWIYKEEGTQWSPQPMKYYHPYLFVNDTKGNLHVFEVDDEMINAKEII